MITMILYSGFCLWGPNLYELFELLQASKFYFCSLILCTFVSAHCTWHSSVLVISLSYVSVHRGTLLFHCLTQKTKGLWWLCAWIMCMMTWQHFSNVANSPAQTSCRCGILWSQSLYICSINDSTLDNIGFNFTQHYTWQFYKIM